MGHHSFIRLSTQSAAALALALTHPHASRPALMIALIALIRCPPETGNRQPATASPRPKTQDPSALRLALLLSYLLRPFVSDLPVYYSTLKIETGPHPREQLEPASFSNRMNPVTRICQTGGDKLGAFLTSSIPFAPLTVNSTT